MWRSVGVKTHENKPPEPEPETDRNTKMRRKKEREREREPVSNKLGFYSDLEPSAAVLLQPAKSIEARGSSERHLEAENTAAPTG